MFALCRGKRIFRHSSDFAVPRFFSCCMERNNILILDSLAHPSSLPGIKYPLALSELTSNQSYLASTLFLSHSPKEIIEKIKCLTGTTFIIHTDLVDELSVNLITMAFTEILDYNSNIKLVRNAKGVQKSEIVPTLKPVKKKIAKKIEPTSSFNLGTSETQAIERDQVKLPFMDAMDTSVKESFYSDDDGDEEDPDDDLDF